MMILPLIWLKGVLELFNVSIHRGVFSDKLKIAWVALVFKGGN